MARTIGPTPGQETVLRELGEDPALWKRAPRHAIFAFIAKRGKEAVAQRRKTQAQYWLRERKKKIAAEKFQPGMEVIRAYPLKKESVRKVPDVITEITESGHLILQGLARPVAPWHIKPKP